MWLLAVAWAHLARFRAGIGRPTWAVPARSWRVLR